MDKFIITPPSTQRPVTNASPSPIAMATRAKTPEPTMKSPKKEPNEEPSKKKPSRVSTIWEHFTKIKDTDPNDPRCTCSMWAHLKNQCKKCPLRVSDKKQKLHSFQTDKIGVGNLLAVSFNKEECRKSLAEMIVLDELPFRYVEGEGFKRFVQNLQPKFVIPSRWTVTRDINQLYVDEQKKLKVELTKEGQRVCLTTDCWTSLQQIPYLCLTAHYIDDNWCLQKRILNFCQISDHKGDTIGKLIKTCLHEWGVERVFTVIIDNASANDVAVNVIKRRVNGWKGSVLNGEFMHLRCCAHIINLIVSEGLRELHDSISAIRNAVRFVRSSLARLQKFKGCVEKEKIQHKGGSVLDVSTRWNSTYIMLDVAIKFQKAFERLEEEEEKYLSYFHEHDGGKKRVGPPNCDDWDNTRVFVNFLRTFYDVTLKFSASLYVTSNTYYHEMCEVQTQLLEFESSFDPLLSTMAASMKKKYDKYWGNVEEINPLLFVAVVLDPRYKLQYVKYCFGCVYEAELAARLTLRVEKTLHQSYAFYDGGQNDANNDKNLVSTPPTVEGVAKNRKLLSQFLKLQQDSYKMEKMNDVDRYLAEENVNPLIPSFDILVWRKENSMRFKVLSLIARDVLAILVSTVASKSAFSTGGKILDPFRSSLTPKTVEALVCTQNWIKSTHEGIQLQSYLEESEDTENGEGDVRPSKVNVAASKAVIID